MVIGGHRRLDFDVREHPKLRVLWQRGSIPSADVAPEVEEKTRAALEGTAEVTVLAQIDSRVENSREDPAVLEKVVSRRRFFRGIGQGALRGQPGNEAFRAEDRGGGKSRECGHAGDSPRGPAIRWRCAFPDSNWRILVPSAIRPSESGPASSVHTSALGH